MTKTTLSFFALFLLLMSAPLLAQTENPEDSQSTEVTATAEATLGAEVNTEDPEANAEASAEVNVDEETEAVDAGATSESASDQELPQTASPLALFALLGLAGAGSALGVRSLRRKA